MSETNRNTEPAPAAPATARASLAPEAELLLLTAAPAPNDGAIDRLVDAGIDWESLCALARHENAAAIVLRHLGQRRSVASERGYGTLRQLATVSVMQMLQLEQLLHQALRQLAEAGIEVMLLKGAALAYTVYASFAERPMGDLDVLIRPAQAEQAWTLLQAQGWTWPATRWQRERYTEHQHLPPLLHDGPAGGAGESFRLEVHSDLLPEGHPFRLPTTTIWESARRVTRNGHSFTVPHPLHQLWYTGVHFAWSHAMEWGGWRALRDVGAIIGRDGVVWPAFVDLARDTRAGTCCYWTLRLARRLIRAPVPDDVLAALRPAGAEWLLNRLERHYVSNLLPSRDGCPSVRLSQRLWEAGIQPGRSGHGRVRPWQVDERWMMADAGPRKQETPASLAAQLRRLRTGWAYLRRLHRFVLPVHAP